MIERRKLRDDERRAWLRLARTETIGPGPFANLVAVSPACAKLWTPAPHLARRRRHENLRIPSEAEAQAEMDALARMGGRFLASIEPEFPYGLAHSTHPAGHFRAGQRGLVRARHGGRLWAPATHLHSASNSPTARCRFGRSGLGDRLGMARGIDHAAHTGRSRPDTVAVLAGGVDTVYPPEHKALYDQLRRARRVVSEMPVGMAPLSRHFPRRNRLISGLSRGVVVIEAAESSGSSSPPITRLSRAAKYSPSRLAARSPR
jgi:DNA processing protein